ncbi:hypothetical protein TNCV_3039951 [Trichonephila clavipes]|uniref:Uncharacterized protein n=1 Tax=Trichonephila clavipes TaxID=2585209 RepID=A0A8X6RSK0_TRICX|nr:hypothetical protein TNCV_3039951 [Trichonephila clavipes]
MMLSTYSCAVSVSRMADKGNGPLDNNTLLWAYVACDSWDRFPTLSWTSPDTSVVVMTHKWNSPLKTNIPQSAQLHVD